MERNDSPNEILLRAENSDLQKQLAKLSRQLEVEQATVRHLMAGHNVTMMQAELDAAQDTNISLRQEIDEWKQACSNIGLVIKEKDKQINDLYKQLAHLNATAEIASAFWRSLLCANCQHKKCDNDKKCPLLMLQNTLQEKH